MPLARGSSALPSVLFNKVVIATIIEMVEMVEILYGRLGKRSVEQVRYVINTWSLPASASEQGNVIGSVRVYIYVIKKNCN